MTTTEYLIQLEDELKYLPLKKRKAVLAQYQYKINVEIDLGVSEEEITKKLPAPSKVAGDIYDSLGIDYLTRRKKAKRSTDILIMIGSIIGIIATISATFVLTYYIGYSIYRLIHLLVLLGEVKEVILMSLFIIPFIALLLLILLYLIDILILVFSFLLEKILYVFNKKDPLQDFSLVELLENKLGKPKLFRKILIGVVVVFVLFGFVNYFMHTYLYRSFTKAEPTRYTNIYEEEVLSNLTLDLDEAKISITKGEKFSITTVSEFPVTFKTSNDGVTSTISTSKLHYFDFLDFLKEPLPIINITIPEGYNLTYNQNTGILNVEEVKLNNVNLSLNSGNLILKNNVFLDTSIKTGSAGITIESVEATNFVLKISSGSANITALKADKIQLNNDNAKTNVEALETTEFSTKIVTGSCYLKDTTVDNITVTLTNGVFDIYNVNAKDVKIVSTSSTNVSFGKANIDKLSSVTLGGGVVAYDIYIGDASITTAGSILFKQISGNYAISCYGSKAEISEVDSGNFIMNTDKTDTSLEYIKADYLEYNGNKSTTTLYYMFGKNMKITETKEDLHLDNDKSISLYDEAKYNKYYQKIEQLIISPFVSYRVEEGTNVTQPE